MDQTENTIPTGRSDRLNEDVVLSFKPTDWLGLLDAVVQCKDDILIARRPVAAPRERRDPLQGWEE